MQFLAWLAGCRFHIAARLNKVARRIKFPFHDQCESSFYAAVLRTLTRELPATKKQPKLPFCGCSINYFALLADARALGAGAGGGATTGFSAERV